jgi:sugar transferase (PEP-CTERM/EpsH1 system associated)
MKILIVTPSLPYPPHWGFGIRVFHIVKNLGLRHEVVLLTVAGDDQKDEIAAIRQYCADVRVVPGPRKSRRRFLQLISLFNRRSFLQSSLYSDALQAMITENVGREHFDIIQVESSHLGGLAFNSDSLLILDEHNIEYKLLQRMYRTERSPVRRLFNWSEFTKFQREEQKFWVRADGVIFTSEQERSEFSEMCPDKPAICGPNGVDVDFFKPADIAVDRNSIVMTGLMRYRPNIDAALFMVNEVLPLIRKKKPDVVFSIVGAGPSDEVLQLAGPNVVVTGEVPDVRPYALAAGLLVVPLRMGSGTRLKVLEGLSLAKPMVTTSLGCEGIEVENNKHLLIADDAESFAQAVITVLDDSNLAASLGTAGRALVEAKYSWVTIVDVIEKFYERLLAKRQ